MEEKKRTLQYLPITLKEVQDRGWDEVDIILVSGDAYVDHPGFGTAVIGRILEAENYKVAIIPQPNWRDDLRDFKKFGQPKLFFGVSSGCMDSMVNHYTANKRLRSDDAYTPGGVSGFRPDYATLVYSQILKKLYPDTPIVLGGIEASLRRITHYDYWQDKLRPSFLVESGADLLVYGMGESPIIELARQIAKHRNESLEKKIQACQKIAQISYLCAEKELPIYEDKTGTGLCKDIRLSSHEDCLKSKKLQIYNFKTVEEESNRLVSARLIQAVGEKLLVINPPNPPSENVHLDKAFDLPYTRMPHPKYKKRGEIPAYTMIRHSVNIHRGCFGGCAFCTISAHQGKQVISRSPESIMKEIETLVEMEDFRGYLSDLGGPSANMYAMGGIDKKKCKNCAKPSCIFPTVCPNLHSDHSKLLDLYKKVAAHPKIKKVFIGSGIRYDMFFPHLTEAGKNTYKEYAEYVIENCVSGRLKVAPEHTEAEVLQSMRKTPFDKFVDFKRFFDRICKNKGLNQQIIPYFISSHPSCNQEDMLALAEKTKVLGYRLEQVQNFTPTPMTLATEIYYSGIDPYTGKKVFVEKTEKGRKAQNQCFFWYKK